MGYSVQIERNMDALTHCIKRVNDGIDMWDWRLSINAGGIDWGIYFNFNIEEKELEISNQPSYDEELYLDEIIDEINKYYNEEEDEEE